MDLSQLIGSTASSIGVQGASGGHHHHHHKSISDQVSQMSSAISRAVQAGTMTSDQATTLQNELANITGILGLSSTAATSSTSTTSSSAAATTGQSNPLAQLSPSQRKLVFSELQDVRKQLYAANTQSANATSAAASSNAVNSLFAQIDTNGNGSIDQSEFTSFLAQIGANSLVYNQQGNSSSVSGIFSGGLFSVSA